MNSHKLRTIEDNGLLLCITIVVITLSTNSCKKFVDVPPPDTELVSNSAFLNATSANAAILAIFSQMQSDQFTYRLSLYTGLSSDELINYSSAETNIQIYSNGLRSDNSNIQTLWSNMYKYIYQANSILENLPNSPSLSQELKNQILGEAYFIRSYMYFYLVNLFENVPLVLVSDYTLNSTIPNAPKDRIYIQIQEDLARSLTLVSDDYVGEDGLTATTAKLRPTKMTVRSMQARVYLYLKKWAEAEQASNDVINSANFQLEIDPNKVFLSNSSESIWQLSYAPYNTVEGINFILTSTPRTSALSDNIISAFEVSDKRKASWLNSITSRGKVYVFPYKYKVASQTAPITEQYTVFRLPELYLIRAESKLNTGNPQDAVSDINIVRSRAGLAERPTSSTTEEILNYIIQERRLEYFSEGAHRWLDLKRTNRLTSIMDTITPKKGGVWNKDDQHYPIPQRDIDSNPNLVQNSGY